MDDELQEWGTETNATPLADILAFQDVLNNRIIQPLTFRLRADIAALITFTNTTPIPLGCIGDACAAHNAGWDDLTWDGITLTGRAPGSVTTTQVPATLKGWD